MTTEEGTLPAGELVVTLGVKVLLFNPVTVDVRLNVGVIVTAAKLKLHKKYLVCGFFLNMI